MLNTEQIAKTLLVAGSVVVMPTDTIYGLVARAEDQAAVARLYALKDRHNKPGTLIGLDIEQLNTLGFNRRYLKAVEQFWPGAVSVEIPLSDDNLKYLSQDKSLLAARVPDNEFVRQVLALTGPLITTSVNLPGEAPANTIKEARGYFNDQVDAYYDGGDLSGHKPSTVIRIIDDAIEVLRAGSIDIPGVI